MPVVRRLLLAGAATALVVGGGVAVLGGGQEPREEPRAESTPLGSFDTSRVAILRTGFCERVTEGAVRAALGGGPEDATAYDNGDRVRLAARVRDRSHEFGCSWTANDATAAAWVFAPPVTRATASRLVRQARAERGCEPMPDAPAYGDPSIGTVCSSPRAREVSFRGLFGDAWLVCSLRSTGVSAGQRPDAQVDRAGRWCVAVAQAARADEDPG